MIALCLGAHVPQQHHMAYPNSLFRSSTIGLLPHGTLGPGHAAPNRRYGLQEGRFNWLLYYSLSFDLTLKAAGPVVDTSLREICRIGEHEESVVIEWLK